MKKGLTFLIAIFAVLSFTLSTPAFAKKEGSPAGWAKGEKKGWNGADVPPGLAKKDAAKAEKEAKKQAKAAEKETKKKQKEAEKAAKKAKENAEKAVS